MAPVESRANRPAHGDENKNNPSPAEKKKIAQNIASCIDHTLLKSEAKEADISKLCEEARSYQFASVCINPSYVKLAAGLLKGSDVKVCTVIGFPLGANLTEIKVLETREAVRQGAQEIDMVINIGALKSGNADLVYKDIQAVAAESKKGGALIKVIIETALLSDEEKLTACQLARRAEADFVKTSTGFASGGATARDVALMLKAVSGTGMGVKASGGIRSYADALEMIIAGATRIGASAGVKIVREAREAAV